MCPPWPDDISHSGGKKEENRAEGFASRGTRPAARAQITGIVSSKRSADASRGAARVFGTLGAMLAGDGASLPLHGVVEKWQRMDLTLGFFDVYDNERPPF